MSKIIKKQLAIIAGTVVFLTMAGANIVAASDMDPALKSYMQGEYSASLPAVSKLAREGNPEAQFALGLAYEHGRSVTMNPIRAMYWYDSAGKTYTKKGATIASRFCRLAIARLQQPPHFEQVVSNH
ncbi:MAG: sel1 repeat family protein [Proteobacteria bacterium]|nr:sel1 repeat family protein [Pseudomonadota bacterium]